jgi:hypothetical protein
MERRACCREGNPSRRSVSLGGRESFGGKSNHHMLGGESMASKYGVRFFMISRSHWKKTVPKPAVAMTSNRQISRPNEGIDAFGVPYRLYESIVGIALSKRMDQVQQEIAFRSRVYLDQEGKCTTVDICSVV